MYHTIIPVPWSDSEILKNPRKSLSLFWFFIFFFNHYRGILFQSSTRIHVGWTMWVFLAELGSCSHRGDGHCCLLQDLGAALGMCTRYKVGCSQPCSVRLPLLRGLCEIRDQIRSASDFWSKKEINQSDHSKTRYKNPILFKYEEHGQSL